MKDWYRTLRPLIHRLPPEKVHALGIAALRRGLLPAPAMESLPSLPVRAFGISFPNPIGLAAGFDKNAEATGGLLRQGFGFVEAGTVTPLLQPGNPAPRLFRLSEDEAVINRLGFNNQGLEAFAGRLQGRDRSLGIVGANIGKNKNSTDAVADYVTGLQRVYNVADYITVNISSPNTPGLRALQKREALGQLLASLQEARAACVLVHGKQVPLLLKVAPDLNEKEQEDIAYLVQANGIDGLIVGNTTLARPASLASRWAGEQGGLSGRPLMVPSTQLLGRFYQMTSGKIPLIGVGGIASAEDAYAKIRAGATLVQLYTALVYQGFAVVREIRSGLAGLLQRDGFAHVADAVGADHR